MRPGRRWCRALPNEGLVDIGIEALPNAIGIVVC